MLSKIGKFYSEVLLYKTAKRLTILAEIALFVAMMVNLIMVIVRKLFPALGIRMGGPIVGGYEVTQVAMIFVSVSALAYTWYTAGHIRVGLFRDKMKERPRAAWDAFYALLATLYVAVIIWAIYNLTKQYFAIKAYTPLMQIQIPPFMIIYIIVMIHAFLVFLRSTIGLVSKALGKKFAVESYLENQ